jgi:chromosome segregation ATPase
VSLDLDAIRERISEGIDSTWFPENQSRHAEAHTALDALVGRIQELEAELIVYQRKVSDDRQTRWSMQARLDSAATRLADYERRLEAYDDETERKHQAQTALDETEAELREAGDERDTLREALDSLDQAARYYREALKHVIEECGNDKPRIAHIEEAAARGVTSADAALTQGARE